MKHEIYIYCQVITNAENLRKWITKTKRYLRIRCTVPSNIFSSEWNKDKSGFDDRICSEVLQKDTRFLHF